MKNSVWYNRLWQNKMHEFPLEGDANNAWQKMQVLLNENMPVTTPAVPAKQAKSLTSKLTSLIIIIVITALLYYVGTLLFGNHTAKPGKIKDNHKLNSKSLNIKPNAGKKNRANNNAVPGNKANNYIYKKLPESVINNNILHKKNIHVNNKFSAAGNYSSHSRHMRGYQYNHNGMPVNGNNYAGKTNAGSQYNQKHVIIPTKQASNGKSIRLNLSANAINNISANWLSIKSFSDVFIKPAYIKNSDSVTKNHNAKAKFISNNPLMKNKAMPDKKTGHSKFGLYLNVGLSTNRNAATTPFAGVSGSYLINPKLSLSTGAAISEKIIRGGYINDHYRYTTISDSGKRIINTADKLIINSSRKIFTIDIPININYKVSNYITFHAGTGISFPLKSSRISNSLAPVKNPPDSLSAYKAIDSTVNTTTITNHINLSITGGIRLNLNRFYMDASYLQTLKPYIISSSLGSTKTYYHTFQFGIGFLLFKPKSNSFQK